MNLKSILIVLGLALAVAAVTLAVLYAPVALAVAVWLVWPVVFCVFIYQLVKAHEPEPESKRRPGIVVHDDGSVEVQR